MQCFPSLAVSQHLRDSGCDVHVLPGPHNISQKWVCFGASFYSAGLILGS